MRISGDGVLVTTRPDEDKEEGTGPKAPHHPQVKRFPIQVRTSCPAISENLLSVHGEEMSLVHHRFHRILTRASISRTPRSAHLPPLRLLLW